MQRVFGIGKNKKALMPCNRARAKRLLDSNHAAVFKKYPFSRIFKDWEAKPAQLAGLRIDQDSKTTAISLAVSGIKTNRDVFALNLNHRANLIQKALTDRRSMHKGWCNRKTHYRKSRFLNRTRPETWLPPSLRITSKYCGLLRHVPAGTTIYRKQTTGRLRHACRSLPAEYLIRAHNILRSGFKAYLRTGSILQHLINQCKTWDF
ncbi:MAG: hypothetical protein GY874_01140 [Desulfobacteraceae bacterium]|nr:hypothetical protein [Desulfobacteraceae bacterium]